MYKYKFALYELKTHFFMCPVTSLLITAQVDDVYIAFVLAEMN